MQSLGLPSLQGVYNANVTPPHITLDGAAPLTISEPTASSGAPQAGLSVRRAAGNAAVGWVVADQLYG